MAQKILLVTATQAEAASLKNISGIINSPEGFLYGNCEISLLITGVGAVPAAWAMTRWFYSHPKPDLAINAGIAGSFNPDIKVGDVVLPVSDCFADAGIETPDGFYTMSEAGLRNADSFPFQNGRITAGNRFFAKASKLLKTVNAISVNRTSGSEPTISRLREMYNPDIETMEGATFFYICAMEKIPFMGIRSVSNFVEPRQREKWDVPLALANLTRQLASVLLISA